VTAIVVVHMLAAGLGATLALGAPDVWAGKAAEAAPHCTRYGPSILDPDVNCGVNNSMVVGTYQTPSTALRDGNAWNSNASRCFDIWYPNSVISYHGCGDNGTTPGSGGAYRAAACNLNGGQSSVFANCTTYWHD
jgi:hypothetical protein